MNSEENRALTPAAVNREYRAVLLSIFLSAFTIAAVITIAAYVFADDDGPAWMPIWMLGVIYFVFFIPLQTPVMMVRAGGKRRCSLGLAGEAMRVFGTYLVMALLFVGACYVIDSELTLSTALQGLAVLCGAAVPFTVITMIIYRWAGRWLNITTDS